MIRVVANLEVRLQPRSGRNEIVGERNGQLLVRVAAAPVDGKANAALCKLIAKAAGVSRGEVAIVQGATSRDKVVRVDGVSEKELRRRLAL
jgi:uncharacterized protein (TIGR00251 family)